MANPVAVVKQKGKGMDLLTFQWLFLFMASLLFHGFGDMASTDRSSGKLGQLLLSNNTKHSAKTTLASSDPQTKSPPTTGRTLA